MGLRSLLCIVTLAGAGCFVSSPDVIAPGDEPVANVSYFVDAVLGISDGADVTACFTAVPLCNATPEPAAGPCENNAAVGEKDGAVFEIPPLGRLELGFLCSFIREVGVQFDSLGNPTTTIDFKIWGTVVGPASPVIEVSQDATHYVAVNLWTRTSDGGYIPDPGFRLEVPMLSYARYVRISEVSGQGSIRVDAVEALPVASQ